MPNIDPLETVNNFLIYLFLSKNSGHSLIALKIAARLIGFLMGVVGLALGLAMFLLFTVGPLVLLGWLASWVAVRRFVKRVRLS